MVSEGNGCGPAWLPQKVKNALGLNKYFCSECCAHDRDYRQGGTSSDRLRYDNRFRDDMLKKARKLEVKGRVVAISTAYIFYCLVRLFGSTRFNYKND